MSATTFQIKEAAEALRRGELVAFPTETVYGLGANALDAGAVERIFTAKGRPKTSPLIVHVANVEMARAVASEWPDSAQRLAERFWPGPLSIVLPKSVHIPDAVTGGLGTVGIRIPNHPVALAFLETARLPVAAPSANMFTKLSSTTAAHVKAAFPHGLIVLDGGDSAVGIESTVVSLAGTPRLLRPGAVTLQELESILGTVAVGIESPGDGAHSSPGLHPKHYQPRTPLVWAREKLPVGKGAYLYIEKRKAAEQVVAMSAIPAGFAAELYKTLHRLDAAGLDWIAIEPLPDGEDWAALRDRLQRAVQYVLIS